MIILADDEIYIRSSAIKLIEKIAREKNWKINIFESFDGLETLYLTYKCLLKGINIDLILSDESMNYWKGSKSSEEIKRLFDELRLESPPFYLVTAYDSENFAFLKTVKKVLTKPLNSEQFINILKEYFS